MSIWRNLTFCRWVEGWVEGTIRPIEISGKLQVLFFAACQNHHFFNPTKSPILTLVIQCAHIKLNLPLNDNFGLNTGDFDQFNVRKYQYQLIVFNYKLQLIPNKTFSEVHNYYAILVMCLLHQGCWFRSNSIILENFKINAKFISLKWVHISAQNTFTFPNYMLNWLRNNNFSIFAGSSLLRPPKKCWDWHLENWTYKCYLEHVCIYISCWFISQGWLAAIINYTTKFQEFFIF